MPLKVGSSDLSHRFIGTAAVIKRYIGTNKIWEALSPPSITTFTASPNPIDLDTRASGNISFNIVVPVQSGGSPQATASDIVFVYDRRTHKARYTSSEAPQSYFGSAQGSSSIENSNLLHVSGDRLGYNNGVGGYNVWLKSSYVKLKTPIAMEIDGSSFNFIDGSFVGSISSFYFSTGQISSASRISPSSLRKSINVELVDNEQVTLRRQTAGGRDLYRSNLTGAGEILFSDNQFISPIPNDAWVLDYSLSKTPTHIVVNGRAFSVTKNGSRSEYYTSTITDSNFMPSATNLSWSINVPFSDGTYLNNTRSHLFQSTSAPATGPTYAQVVKLPEGTNVGNTLTAAQGSAINSSGEIMTPQPQKTTSYRVFVHNNTGGNHKDTEVVVTKNPTITNLRRTNVVTRAGFSTYTFAFTVTGLPRPAVTFDFSNFAESSGNRVATTHFIQGSNPYTWNVSGWSVTFPNSDARSLTLTATNGSGSVTASLANINS